MSSSRSCEDRLTALVAEVAQIEDQLRQIAKPQNWLDRVVGSMTRHPRFDEVFRLGREPRQAERSTEDA
jgi:hypothetical protein